MGRSVERSHGHDGRNDGHFPPGGRYRRDQPLDVRSVVDRGTNCFRDDHKPGEAEEGGDKVISQALCEVKVFTIFAQILEGENGGGWLIGESGRRLRHSG